jgi:hypothetical protein
MAEKRMPPLLIALVGLVLQALWIYLQIKHWGEPAADYMAIALNIAVTALLWVFLGFFITKVRKMEPGISVVPSWVYPALVVPLFNQRPTGRLHHWLEDVSSCKSVSPYSDERGSYLCNSAFVDGNRRTAKQTPIHSPTRATSISSSGLGPNSDDT